MLLRSDGRPTYFCMDVAYHYQKLKVSDRVVDILGPDHHGYIERLKGMAGALGYPGRIEVTIAQQVALMRGAQQVAMSKRAGEIVTLDEILDEVGIDAARFFFIMLAVDSPLTFDLQLAVEKASEVRCITCNTDTRASRRYCAARLPKRSRRRRLPSLAPLTHPAELTLIRRLAYFPRVLAGVVENLAPHRLARYARDVATEFHQFYTECKILAEERDVRLRAPRALHRRQERAGKDADDRRRRRARLDVIPASVPGLQAALWLLGLFAAAPLWRSVNAIESYELPDRLRDADAGRRDRAGAGTLSPALPDRMLDRAADLPCFGLTQAQARTLGDGAADAAAVSLGRGAAARRVAATRASAARRPDPSRTIFSAAAAWVRRARSRRSSAHIGGIRRLRPFCEPLYAAAAAFALPWCALALALLPSHLYIWARDVFERRRCWPMR